MNIYIVMTESCEYIASYADEVKAKEFVAHCNSMGDHLHIRYDWLIGVTE